MDPHSFIARAEAQRWLGIAEKLLISHDLVGSKTFAIRARESDPRLEAAEQILAIADTLLAAEKRVVGNNGAHQPDFYAILQLVRFVEDTEHITSQYRRLAVLLNPHQNRFPYSDQAFQLVNDAWAVLSNPMRKSMYDSDLDYPPQQQMNTIGFNLEQQHHQQQHHQQQQQQQQPHNFFSVNHMGAGHEQELPEQQQQQTFQSRLHQQQHQQLQQHNFLSQPNPVRPLPVREQEHMFQHREQEHLFQPQVQPFQVTSPPHQQNRPSPQPHIQSPPATPQSPFSWPQAPQLSQPHQKSQQSQSQFQQQHHQLKQEQQQHHHQHQIKQEHHHQHEQQLQQQMKQEQQKQQQLKQEQLKQQQLQQEQLKQQQLQQEQLKQQQLKHQQMLEEQRKQQQLLEEQRKQQQLQEEQRKQQQLMEEQQRKQQQLLEEQRKQQQLQEEQRKQQQLLEEQRKQQQLFEEQRKQQQLQEEQQRKQQQLLEEQRKQQQLLEEQRKQQQMLEEQRKQQQMLEEQRKQQQLIEEQRKQQQLIEEQRRQQEQQQKQESLNQNATPIQSSNPINTNNGVLEEEAETEAETDPGPEDDSPTFWTACPFCFYMYEYPKLYIECTLRCDNCKRAFQAVRIASPPPIIEGQDACFYCWGFFPLGLSMSHLQKDNNQNTTASNWTPFSSLHTTSNNTQNHLNEQAAPKQNLFVNKSSGPRIYVDDIITDDVLIGVSEPRSDSDIEWKLTKKQQLKKMDKGFKERIQVLALRATCNTRTTSVKILKDGVKNPKKQSKLDLNVAAGTRVHEVGEEGNIGGTEFFEGLDEYLTSLPILSVVNEDNVKVA